MHLDKLLNLQSPGFLICSMRLAVPRIGHRGSNQPGALAWCPAVSACRNPHQEPTGPHRAASWCLEGRSGLLFFLPSKNPSLGRYRESVLSSLKRKVYMKLWSHEVFGMGTAMPRYQWIRGTVTSPQDIYMQNPSIT